MQAWSALGGAGFLLATAVVGIRLLVQARRRGTLTELLLGLAFLLGGALGAPLEASGMAAGGRLEAAGTLLGAGKLFGLLGMLSSCLFTWWVFRRHDAKGLGIVLCIMAPQLAGFLGHLASGAFRTAGVEPLWFWLELAGRIASPAWLGFESWLYWVAVRRRVRIGLADPVLTNRFLLFSIASLTGILCLLTSVPPVYLPAGHPVLELAPLLFAAAGIATASAHWLAFFPNAGYRRFLEQRAVPEPA